MPPDGARVSFSFDGSRVEARDGQSVAAALLEAGVTTLSRSPKYRRPRGVHCAAGHCPSCLLRVDGAEHVRSCMLPVREGMRVETSGATARRVDPLRAIDRAGRLFPVGFQYRYFKRQNALWRLWEGQLRRTAAETEIPAVSEIPPARRFCADLLVVGAGPAGLAAAAAAAEAGLRVVLASRRERLGGRLRPYADSARMPAGAQRALEVVRGAANVEVIAPATVVAAFEDRYVVDAGDHAVEVTAPASVLATGAYERALPFPGNDRPGVMLTSALRQLVLDDGALRGRRAVLVATDDSVHPMARELVEGGLHVAAIVDPAATRVVGVRWPRRVTGLRIETPAGERAIPCDVVGMSGGWQPADELRYVATSDGQDVVVGERAQPIDPGAAGAMPKLQGVGMVVGTVGEAALEEGARAGAWAAERGDG